MRLCGKAIRYRSQNEMVPKPRTFTKPTINIVHQVRVPLWIPFALLATYPCCSFTLRAGRRYRRGRRNQCVGCGYDLTGNESGMCPECGNKK